MTSSPQQISQAAAPRAGQVFTLAWPMTLKAVFLHGTVVIDGWLVSSLGESSVGAMGLAAAIGGVILGVIFAFSHAMQIRTAQAYGTGDRVFLKSALASGLSLSVAIGVIGVFVIALLGQTVIGWLAPNVQIAANAWAYLTVFTFVILGESIGQCLSSFFNGCGRTRIPFYGYCLSVPINVATSIVFIHGLFGFPAMGVAGAALGSALGVWVQVAFFVANGVRKDGNLRHVTSWRQTTFAQTLTRHAVFALPIAATFVSATLATHVCTMFYAQMDLYAFAALTLITPWSMVAGQISMQWTQATGIIVAQLLGQETPQAALDRFMSVAWRGAFVAAAVVAVILLVMCLSVDVIYPDLSAQTRATLMGFLPLLLVIQIPRATNAICGNTLRASGDTIYVMHIFVWSQWLFRVPATIAAVVYFDVSAFWILAIMLGEELIKFLPFHRRMWRGDWKTSNVAA